MATTQGPIQNHSSTIRLHLFHRRTLRPFWRLILVIGLSVFSYLVISHFIINSVEVVGNSMYPTLQNAGHYFLNRWVYHWRDPVRGDVVVIEDPSNHDFSVKRIIAGSGEAVHLKGGDVYVNGKKLEEPYLRHGTRTLPYRQIREQRISCREGEYVVLGDNRGDSIDSRYFGAVPRKNILGAVWGKFGRPSPSLAQVSAPK